MKYLGFLLLIFTCFNVSVYAQNETSPKKFDIYIQVKIINEDLFSFSYQDSNYLNAFVNFVHNKKGDTVIVKKITTDKPTVFTFSEAIENRLYFQEFIGFNNNDTISFEMDHHKLSYVGNDRRNYIANQIFEKKERALTHKKFTIPEFANQQIAIENERANRLEKLANLISIYPIDSSSIKTIKSIIELSFYYDIFNVNYSGEKQNKWENPFFSKFIELDKKTKILGSISSPSSTHILYELIQYGAYLNNSQKTDILENLQYLTPGYFKTIIINGFILNMIDFQAKTYEEREKLLTKLKGFMLNNSEPLNYDKKPIGNEVNKATFVSFTNKQVTFKDLLKTDKKIIVFDFWASWCVPCISEIPNIKRLTKKLPNVKFISISLDKESQKWSEACNKYNIKFNSFRILNLADNELLKYFGIRSIPRFIVMTNKGEVLSDDFYRPSNIKFEVDLKWILEAYK